MKEKFEVEFDEIYKGIRIVGIMTFMGCRCGYISIPPEHPLYGIDYNKIDIKVHGGLTYSSLTTDYPVKTEKDTYWVGFDCAHYGDGKDYDAIIRLNPDKGKQIVEIYSSTWCSTENEILRSKLYVLNECRDVVNQITDYKLKQEKCNEEM